MNYAQYVIAEWLKHFEGKKWSASYLNKDVYCFTFMDSKNITLATVHIKDLSVVAKYAVYLPNLPSSAFITFYDLDVCAKYIMNLEPNNE